VKRLLDLLQPIGRALMLPIAVLPVAGLLLRLGQADLLNLPFIAAAGDAVFANLGLLFAIGVAVGLAKDSNGAAGLAGVVCYLIATKGAETLIAVPPSAYAGMAASAHDLAASAFRDKALARLSVPLGVISGVIAGNFYNRFNALKLPEYLAFFGGRRFVPIISGAAGLGLAVLFGLGWSALAGGMDQLSVAITRAGPWGLFAYGVLNRVLIVTGLHHILNNVVWFILGDYHGVTGDLHRFFAGDPTAGGFMTGFFPVMMFGLPGACLAMYHTARPERRAAVGGMLLSLALTAFLTGVTEPIEFSFMFLAPGLYVMHAILTGVAMAGMNALGVHLGFGFSAGLFDYVLNFQRATRPLLLLPVGAAYFALYYGVFRFCIQRFDLKTPGREAEDAAPDEGAELTGERGRDFVIALGGAANLTVVEACTTRLRLVVADQGAVDHKRLSALGARGSIKPSPNALQVVLGPIAEQVAGEIKAALAAGPQAVAAPRPVQAAAPVAPVVTAADRARAEALLAALGGAGNLSGVGACSARLYMSVRDEAKFDAEALKASGVRAWIRTGGGEVQLLLTPEAAPVGAAVVELSAEVASA
jgi:N-acetylglucosamine PTS system EIICBA or EIICB component